jgi:hypothetical protein
VSQLYSIGGAIFLFMLGQYFFFLYPEWYVSLSIVLHSFSDVHDKRQIYGGIGIGVGCLCVINMVALSNVRDLL